MTELIIGWILGLLTQDIARDKDVINICREILFDLQQDFENLNITLFNSTRNENIDYKMILIIKGRLQKLLQQQPGLFISCLGLSERISESLAIIRRMEKEPKAPQNQPNNIGIDLCLKWGKGQGYAYEAIEVVNLHKFFYGGLIKRIWLSRWKYYICFFYL